MSDRASAITSPPEHYEDVPQEPKKGRALVAWQDFEVELQARERDIVALLPGHVTRERFMTAALTAVKQNPDLLRATPRSLFTAITKSAQDGILPDGREGVITLYGDIAQWNPMTHGLRKRARELDGILIDAQVVYANDKFVWSQGDNPGIEHTPAALGQPRGIKIGAYAIFKRESGTILHREVMDSTQIETVRSQSRAKDSLMWTKFAEEGYRKVVIRRGLKSVPASEKLEQIVHHDDEAFSFDAPASPPNLTGGKGGGKNEFTRKPQAKAVAPLPSQEAAFAESERQPDPPATASMPEPEPEPQPGPDPGAKIAEPDAEPTTQAEAVASAVAGRDDTSDEESPLARGARLLALCKFIPDIADLRASIAEEITDGEKLQAWNAACDARTKEVVDDHNKQAAAAHKKKPGR